MREWIENVNYVDARCPSCGEFDRISLRDNKPHLCDTCENHENRIARAICDTKLSIARELYRDRWSCLVTDWRRQDTGGKMIYATTVGVLEYRINRLALEALGWEGI